MATRRLLMAVSLSGCLMWVQSACSGSDSEQQPSGTLAIDGGTSGATSPDGSAPVGDSGSAGDSTSAGCALENDECVGSGCCPPLRGSRVSEDRTCVAGNKALFCFDGPGIGCATDEELGCFIHEVDGSQEVFRTSSVTSEPLPPGWARCGAPLNLEVAHIGKTCP